MIKKYSYSDIKKIEYEELDSTSSFLKREYKGLDNLTFVSTKRQTSGHGRMNREWHSGDGENLLFSVLIKDDYLIDNFDSLSLLTATVIYKVLINLGINEVAIKWPNDVFVNNKKISGILLEGVSYDNKLDCLIIGVGLNVNDINLDGLNATSISLELMKILSINNIKEKVYNEFINSINEFYIDNKLYLKIIRNNNYLKDKSVYIFEDNIQREGIVLDINDDNSLKVKVNNNNILNIKTDEVIMNIKS